MWASQSTVLYMGSFCLPVGASNDTVNGFSSVKRYSSMRGGRKGKAENVREKERGGV